jgi:hypothetical protein
MGTSNYLEPAYRQAVGWHAWVFLIQTRRNDGRILERSIQRRSNEVWPKEIDAPEGSVRRTADR